MEQGASSDAGAGSGAGSGAGEERRSTLRLSKHELAVYMDMDVVRGPTPWPWTGGIIYDSRH